MAIIKCPECGRQISDKAPTCPSCGVEIAGKITKCPHCGDNWIEVSVNHCDEGSDIPKVGDVMVQLGDIDDPDYQAAIMLSATADTTSPSTIATVHAFHLLIHSLFPF